MSDGQFSVGVQLELDLDQAEGDLRAGFQEMARDAERELTKIGKAAEREADRAGKAFGKSRTALGGVNAEADRSPALFSKMGGLADGLGSSLGSMGKIGVGALGGIAEFAGRGALALGGMALNVAKLGTLVAGGGLVALTGIGIKTAASLESAQAGFAALLGGAEQGKAFFGGLVELANRSAFEVGQLTGPAQTLLAVFKGDAAGATAALGTLGNAVALLGKNSPEALARLADGFGKAASQGKFSAESLNIIGEAIPGFAARQELAIAVAERYGMSQEEATERISKGAISAAEGTELLLARMEKFPGLSKAMEAQAKTLGGVLSTFSDTVKSALAFDLAGPLIEPIKGFIAGLTPLLGESLKGLGQGLAPIISGLLPTLLEGLTPLLKAAPSIIAPFVDGYAAIFKTLAPVMGEFAGAMVPIAEALGDLTREVAPEIGTMASVLVGALDPLARTLQTIGVLFANITPGLASFVTSVTGALSALADPADKAAAKIGRTFGPVLEQLGKLVSVVGPQLGEGLLGGLGNVAGALGPILSAAIPLLQLLGSTGAVIFPLIGELASQLSPVLVTLVNGVRPVAEAITGALLDALKTLAPVLPTLAGALGELALALVQLLPPLLPLIPPVTELLVLLTDSVLVPAITALAGVFQELAKHGEALRLVVVALAAAFVVGKGASLIKGFLGAEGAARTLIPTLVNLGKSMYAALGPWGIAAAAVAAVAAGAIYAYKHFEPFRNVVDAVGRALRDFGLAVADKVWPVLQRVGAFLGQVFTVYWKVLRTELNLLIGVARAIVGAFQDPLGTLQRLGDVVLGFLASLPGRLLDFITTLGPILGEAMLSALGFVGQLVLGWVDSAATFLLGLAGSLISGMISLPLDLITFVTTTLPQVTAQFVMWAASAVGFLAELPGKLILGAIDLAPRLVAFIAGAVAEGTKTVAGWVVDAVTFLVGLPGKLIEGAGDLGGKLVGFLDEELPKIARRIASFVEDAAKWLVDVVPNLIKGLGDIAGKLGTALLEGFKGAWNYLADRFKIDVDGFEVFGKQIGGFSIGLPRLARGAYTDEAMAAVIGEAGPEFALPVNRPADVRRLAGAYPAQAAKVAAALLEGLGGTSRSGRPEVTAQQAGTVVELSYAPVYHVTGQTDAVALTEVLRRREHEAAMAMARAVSAA